MIIKDWNLFKESVDNRSEIIRLCNIYNIRNYTINDDFSINVDGNVDLSNFKLDKIPLKFRKVSGNFNCSFNELSSLDGCPVSVGGYFYCISNKLNSLEFGPIEVGDNFICYNNKITSLEYLPKYIGRDIYCDSNKIWSFRGIPDNFNGNILCSGNPIYRIWNLFKSGKDIEFFNDCHIIRELETPDGFPVVVLERLNFFLETIGKPSVKKVEGYINI
jgi:hypothetical protein